MLANCCGGCGDKEVCIRSAASTTGFDKGGVKMVVGVP